MDLSAAHVGFVVASYLLSGGVLAVLVVVTMFSLKSRERELRELDAKRTPRRKSVG